MTTKLSLTLNGDRAEALEAAAQTIARGLFSGESIERTRRFLVRQAVMEYCRLVIRLGSLPKQPLEVESPMESQVVVPGNINRPLLKRLKELERGEQRRAVARIYATLAELGYRPGARKGVLRKLAAAKAWALPAERQGLTFCPSALPTSPAPAPAAGPSDPEQLAFAWDDLPNVPATVDDPVTRITVCVAEIARRMTVADPARN